MEGENDAEQRQRANYACGERVSGREHLCSPAELGVSRRLYAPILPPSTRTKESFMRSRKNSSEFHHLFLGVKLTLQFVSDLPNRIATILLRSPLTTWRKLARQGP
jgi:hypothetical protein